MMAPGATGVVDLDMVISRRHTVNDILQFTSATSGSAPMGPTTLSRKSERPSLTVEFEVRSWR